jgi:hypothetical protein
VCEWKLEESDLEEPVVVDLPDRMTVVDKGYYPWGKIDSDDIIDQTLASICDAVGLGPDASEARSLCGNCCALNTVIAGLIDCKVVTPAQLVESLFMPMP